MISFLFAYDIIKRCTSSLAPCRLLEWALGKLHIGAFWLLCSLSFCVL